MTDTAPAVELLGIWKRFPGVIANAGTELTVQRGSIHAVLGENGAGKSTLVNVLAGVYRPDEGEVRVYGDSMVFANPAAALAAGIGMVHQEFRLVPTFTVAENIVLGSADRVLHMAAIEGRVEELAERFGLDVEPSRPIWQLSMGERQRVEILKALWRDARVLILDEPTAVLTPAEADELGGIIRRMADDGRSVIFISHKLHEVKEYCDEATVLRGGKTVAASLAVGSIEPVELAELMVGAATELRSRPADQAPGASALKVSGVGALGNRGIPALSDVSFTLHEGEIVGIAGVAGNGQRELADVIAGLRTPTGGSVELLGADVTHATPRERSNAGLAYVPEDRIGVGLAPQLSVVDNAILRSYHEHCQGPLIVPDRAEAFCQGLVDEFNVKTGPLSSPIAGLSGGNLQRLLVGRELDTSPRVVLAAQPTRGLDVQGVRAIQDLLVAQRDQGVGVLMISEDLDELLAISDRILVMHVGRIAAEFDPRTAERQDIGLAMAGELSA